MRVRMSSEREGAPTAGSPVRSKEIQPIASCPMVQSIHGGIWGLEFHLDVGVFVGGIGYFAVMLDEVNDITLWFHDYILGILRTFSINRF